MPNVLSSIRLVVVDDRPEPSNLEGECRTNQLLQSFHRAGGKRAKEPSSINATSKAIAGVEWSFKQFSLLKLNRIRPSTAAWHDHFRAPLYWMRSYSAITLITMPTH